ncbi:MAG TPA: Ig-like domain-containing protein [Ferruginibacter sp.]|nr:Ig-like domain-containing protein [Ferruginibacter sp.]
MKKNGLLVCYIIVCSVLTGPICYAQSTQVLLQGFDWTSSSTGNWYQTVSTEISDIQAAKINAIWLPPPSDAGSDQGYIPRQYYLLDTKYGTQAQLQSLITSLHNSNIKALADIVINHRVGTTDWGDFTNPAWDCSSVVSGDEWTGACGNPDTGGGVPYARDLDHTNVTVQNGIIAWMRWLKNTIGFDGWRYDFVLGYGPKYVKEYNDSTAPYFSVAECWDPSATNINNWITTSQGTSTAFDFSLKGILQTAVQGNLGLLNVGGVPPGLIGINPAKAVTFVDNHDTGPPQNQWPFPAADVMEGYAYILTHPGIPMIFWDHLYTWGLHDQITALIAIRKNNGLTSTSAVNIVSASNNLYAAIIDGKVAMKIGSDSWTPGAGYILKASGTNYAVWDKIATPVISSSLTFTDTVNIASTYKIIASNIPTSYHAISLPAGLSIDTTTGFISGASTATGTYNVGIIAANTTGADTATLVITTNSASIHVTGVSVTPPTASITTSTTTQLTATVAPATATNKNVTWSSNNTAIATISSTGLVTAVTAGTATITVTTADQGKTATSVITVTNPIVTVTGVSVTPPTASITTSTTTQLTATVAPATATNKNVTWSSSNTAIATVSSTGLVTAVTAGTATITVTTADQGKTAASVITVTNPIVTVTGVSVTPPTASITTSTTIQLTATVAPATATNKNVTWSSSNTTIATVSSTGLVTAVTAGTATITVTTADQGKMATSVIIVTNPIVNAPVISYTGTTTICAGQSILLVSSVSSGNQWYKNGVIITGATANTLQVTASGIYTVVATAGGITSPASAGVTITILPVPTAPVISESQDSTLVSSAVSNNQWYVDTAMIAGQTSQQYGPAATGSYAVTTTQNGCTSLLSNEFYFSKIERVSIYPNPATDFITVNFNGNGPFTVTMFSSAGKEVLSAVIVQSGSKLNIAALHRGIYFVKIFDESIQSVIKIVKL